MPTFTGPLLLNGNPLGPDRNFPVLDIERNTPIARRRDAPRSCPISDKLVNAPASRACHTNHVIGGKEIR
jgi:hypothetical protein